MQFDDLIKALVAFQKLTAVRVTAGVLVIALLLAFISSSGWFLAIQGESTPCSPDGFPGRCYAVEPKMCETVWRQSEDICQDLIRKLNLPPTRLTGPIRTKCQMGRIDQAFSYNRVNTAECKSHHEELEMWKRRNPDFQ